MDNTTAWDRFEGKLESHGGRSEARPATNPHRLMSIGSCGSAIWPNCRCGAHLGTAVTSYDAKRLWERHIIKEMQLFDPQAERDIMDPFEEYDEEERY